MPSVPKNRQRPYESQSWIRVFSAVSVATLVVGLAGCGSSGDGSKSDSAAAAATADPSLFPGKAASGTPVQIGVITNDDGSTISQPEVRQAAVAATKYANDHLGGLAGHPIDLIICGTKEEPATARDCANQMVEKKIDAVVLTSSGLGGLKVPIVAAAGIPWVSWSANSHAELTDPHAFSWTGGFVGMVASWAQYAREKGYKNVTIYTIDVPSALQVLKNPGASLFAKACVKLKLQPIPPGTPDTTPQVQTGLQDKPGAVGVVGYPTVCTSVLKALGVAAYSGDKLVIQPCLADQVVSGVGQTNLRNVQLLTNSDVISGHPEAELYRAVMQKYSPDTPTQGFTVVGYQSMLGFVRATKSLTGRVTPASISAALKSAKDVPLPAGHGVTFTCNGKALPSLTAVCSTQFLVTPLKDGKPTAFKIVNPSELFTK